MSAEGTVTVNHLGLCVTDVDRSRSFYESALGFAFAYEIHPPDPVCSTLLEVAEPVGLSAVYLTNGSFTLELLHFERPGNPPAARRVMNEPGLTHLSFTVPDLPTSLEAVRAHGGEVLEQTDVTMAVMVRDPDGQLLELLPARKG